MLSYFLVVKPSRFFGRGAGTGSLALPVVPVCTIKVAAVGTVAALLSEVGG